MERIYEIKGGGEYVPTINLDEGNLYLLLACKGLKLKPGQWVVVHGEKCRYLYTRDDGVVAFSRYSAGQTALAWSKRMANALMYYRDAKAEAEAERAKRIVADMPLFTRVKVVAGLS